MTPKQQRFVDEFLIDLNGTQAAIRAGYSKRSANRIASETLTKPDIQAAIADAQRKRSHRTAVTQDAVLQRLASIAFFDICLLFDDSWNLLPATKFPPQAAAAIANLEVIKARGRMAGGLKVRLHDKVRALELLAKHLGLFKEQPAPPSTGLSIDVSQLARLSDEDLDQAIAKIQKMCEKVEGPK